ncbi:hypothetical protein DMC47_42250 [Nostoc sp. 3335mG]|nr:hypothetical protein DMC47_42250 [Nostoc sp. 3335mG]
MVALASCVGPQEKPAPAPPRPALPPPPAALPAAPPQQDWRDVPLTPGDWSWRGTAGQSSIAQYGAAGQVAVFALRCDPSSRNIVFSRGGLAPTPSAAMSFTTSYGSFAYTGANGGGQPPAIVAQASARDPHMDQIAFSRGRFLVDVAGQPRLVLPAWPEVARVIQDCRS